LESHPPRCCGTRTDSLSLLWYSLSLPLARSRGVREVGNIRVDPLHPWILRTAGAPKCRLSVNQRLNASMRFLIRAVSASLQSADLRLLTVSAVVRRRTFSAWWRPEITIRNLTLLDSPPPKVCRFREGVARIPLSSEGIRRGVETVAWSDHTASPSSPTGHRRDPVQSRGLSSSWPCSSGRRLTNRCSSGGRLRAAETLLFNRPP